MDTKELRKAVQESEKRLSAAIASEIKAFKENTGLTICNISVYLRGYDVADDGGVRRAYQAPEVTINIDLNTD